MRIKASVKIKFTIGFKIKSIESHLKMILLLVIFVSSSLSKRDPFLAPKPTPPNGECLQTLEYCKVLIFKKDH